MPVPKHIVAVVCLVSKGADLVLLVRHPLRGWEFPGGQVEEGESLIQALEREVLEETGVSMQAGNLIGVYTNIKPPTKLILSFLGEWVEGELVTSAESLETEWVPRPVALQRVTHPAIYDRMKDMLEYSGRIVYRVYTTDPYQVIEDRFLTGN